MVEVTLSPEGEESEEVSVVIEGDGSVATVSTVTVGQEEHEIVYEDGEIVGETPTGRRAQEASTRGLQTVEICIWGSFDSCEEAWEATCATIQDFCDSAPDFFDGDLLDGIEEFCDAAAEECTEAAIAATCDQECPSECRQRGL